MAEETPNRRPSADGGPAWERVRSEAFRHFIAEPLIRAVRGLGLLASATPDRAPL